MLEVKFYQNENLSNLDFYGERPGETIVVVPSPAIADETRAAFLRQKISPLPSVITISKFLQDELKVSRIPEEQKVMKGKADLLLSLARVWKIHFSKLSFDVFLKAYNHFTELRSHTLRLEIVTPIIEKLDSDLAKAIHLFWLVTDAMNITDEHRAYDLLSQYYRTDLIGESVEIKTIIVIDFTFLSGLQLDLINALALKHKVIIPFPLEIYQSTTNEDWIRWLVPTHQEVLEKKQKMQLHLVEFPRKKLNISIRPYLENANSDFMICSKNLEDEFIFDIPIGDIYFKTSANIFAEEFNELKVLLKNLSLPLTPKNLQEIVTNYCQQALEGAKKNFIRFKVSTILIDLISSYEELSNQEITIEHFDLNVLLHIFQLRLPRTFLVPLIENKIAGQTPGRIFDLKNIQSFDPERKTIVALSSDYSPIKMSEDILTELDFEILNSVGPIKRNQLDFLMTKFKLKRVLSSPNTLFFIEHDLQKHDLGWSEILAEYDLKKVPLKIPVLTKTPPYSEIFKNKSSLKKWDLSANRIQGYLDCPQKFYYDHVEHLKPRIKLDSSILINEMGTIQHDVIDYYIKNYRTFDQEKIEEVSGIRLSHYLKERGINLISQEFEKIRVEIALFSGQAIRFLNQLENTMGDSEYFFEYPMDFMEDKWKVRIRIDCLIKTSQGIILLDFKRSDSGIPNKKEFEHFDKIQLWFYLHYLKIEESEMALVGYLNLMQPEKSLFYTTRNDEPLSFDFKTNLLPKDISVMMNDFSVFLETTKNKMETDSQFLPTPKNSEVCRYCSVAAVCPRGVVN